MANYNLKTQNQKRIGRVLLFLSPFFIFHELIGGLKLHFFTPHLSYLPPAGLDCFSLIAWAVFILLFLYCSSSGVRLQNGYIEYARPFPDARKQKIPVCEITEVAGDEGDLSNDFKESLIITFADESAADGIVLKIDDYDEQELRAFIAALKESRPDCKYSYTDVIPFESRGLIKFLLNANESESLTVKLSKTPTEDAILQLIKSHEKTFWCVYFSFWVLTLCALSYYCFALNAEWSLHPGEMPRWNTSENTAELIRMFRAATSPPAPNYVQAIGLFIALFFQLLLDFFCTAGLPVLTAIWMVSGISVLVLIPLLRSWSPSFVFIDPKSIGMHTTFLSWEGINDVRLEKIAEMADPLDGKLVLKDGSYGRVEIDLTKVPDAQMRQRILRLVDRYAVKAKFNDEFMRTTNTLFDIQFTDLWLESKGDEGIAPVDGQDHPDTLCGGAYTIESLLGYGGQGVTYLARAAQSLDTGRDVSSRVVIKELVLPNYADVRIMQDATSRFERGASLLKDLRHNQIVGLIDYFMEGGKAYLVMEYVQGKTLRETVEESGPLSIAKVRDFGMQMCDILAFLHDRESPVIHCDFAPENLIVTPEGVIKLIDFDVARVVDTGAHTFIAGRPSYTPPEQFRGKPTVQSDIFALGAILHFMLSAKDPPPLCAGAIADHDQENALPSIPLLEEMIQRCSAFEASCRPESAREVREILAQLEAGTNDVPVDLGDLENLENIQRGEKIDIREKVLEAE